MGLSSSLLSIGTRSLVAGTGLVPDSALTRRLMVGFHRRIAAGEGPAAALAGAGATVRQTSPWDRTVAATFNCYGVG